jgi:hypothetical protein
MDGELRFRSLSHFKQLEDGEIRGDHREGSVFYQPKGGIKGYNETQAKDYQLPDGSYFDSGVKFGEIFIMCASNSMTDNLRLEFKAKACVQILRPKTLLERISYELPSSATVRAEPVIYYNPGEEIGPKWAFPDLIAFSKTYQYAWQDEFRYAFSITDALKYGSTKQQIILPDMETGLLPKPQPFPHVPEFYIRVKSLGSICRLHIFE